MKYLVSLLVLIGLTLHVASDAGLVLVIAPNDGRAIPEEGSTIRLVWRAEDMTLTRAESAP